MKSLKPGKLYRYIGTQRINLKRYPLMFIESKNITVIRSIVSQFSFLYNKDIINVLVWDNHEASLFREIK